MIDILYIEPCFIYIVDIVLNNVIFAQSILEVIEMYLDILPIVNSLSFSYYRLCTNRFEPRGVCCKPSSRPIDRYTFSDLATLS